MSGTSSRLGGRAAGCVTSGAPLPAGRLGADACAVAGAVRTGCCGAAAIGLGVAGTLAGRVILGFAATLLALGEGVLDGVAALRCETAAGVTVATAGAGADETAAGCATTTGGTGAGAVLGTNGAYDGLPAGTGAGALAIAVIIC